ncbi:MFS transporter [Glaciimonas soli]|uniref:MFS transporter n=1 Tax=Glaciimonas soli TaxID=2590999 RepID=A0A843YLB6_9BURK|nr:MFS transporter [Glaciimonas soli]MQR00215.1 MFS transporter [Glaciimonas soli]
MSALQSHDVIDVGDIIERQHIGRFAIKLIVVLGLMMMTEGYDLGALAFAAPAVGRAWHLGRGALGPVFGAFVFGTMVGALVLGYAGDLRGRKWAMLIGTLTLGCFTLATVWSTNLEQMLILRFCAGVGIGGVVPNAIAYITEFAPKRWRASWVTLMYTGYTIGTGLGGFVAAGLIPSFGWEIVFVIGGIAPLLMGGVFALSVPESIRFLALKGRQRDVVARMVTRLLPGTLVDSGSRFVVGEEVGAERSSASFSALLSGRLRLLTPILWLVYIANSMALFFLISWLPYLIEATGIASGRAALISTLFSLGGMSGGLALMRFIDRRGAAVITVLPLIGTPIVALLGSGMPDVLLIAAVFATGFCVTGAQFGLNAVAAMIYPTALRAKGVGTAVGIQKIGAIAGPVIGGMLLARHLPVRELFYFGAIPVLSVTLLSFVLGQLYRRNEEGNRADEDEHGVEQSKSKELIHAV